MRVYTHFLPRIFLLSFRVVFYIEPFFLQLVSSYTGEHNRKYVMSIFQINMCIAQSVKAVKYTDCFTADGKTPPNECPGYETKQSDGEVPVMLAFWGNT